MFCSNCGSKVEEGVAFCPSCGASLNSVGKETPEVEVVNSQPEEIKSGLGLAVFITVCCCVPFGIVAIVFASKVSGLVAEGKIKEAKQAAHTSKVWAYWGLGIGLAIQLINAFVHILAAIAGTALEAGHGY